MSSGNPGSIPGKTSLFGSIEVVGSVGRRGGMRGGVLVEIETFLVSGMSDTPNFFLNIGIGLQCELNNALRINTCLHLTQGDIRTL